jgi:hypothetical protein
MIDNYTDDLLGPLVVDGTNELNLFQETLGQIAYEGVSKLSNLVRRNQKGCCRKTSRSKNCIDTCHTTTNPSAAQISDSTRNDFG